MKITTHEEFLFVYEELLAIIEECKDSHELAIAIKKLQDFEENYTELMLEYYYEKYSECNE